jgi:hypothetical protein
VSDGVVVVAEKEGGDFVIVAVYLKAGIAAIGRVWGATVGVIARERIFYGDVTAAKRRGA